MSIINNREIQANQAGLILQAGSFAPAGAGAPTAIFGNFTVVRTAAGRFTITWAETAMRLVALVATCQLVGNATDIYAQCGIQTATTAIIRTLTAATETDIAADANNRVTFVAIWQEDTSIT